MLTEARPESSGAMAEVAATPAVTVTEDGEVLNCALSGVWTTRTVASVDAAVRALEGRSGKQAVRLDLAGVSRIDTAGELDYYKSGGVLHYVLRTLAA